MSPQSPAVTLAAVTPISQLGDEEANGVAARTQRGRRRSNCVLTSELFLLRLPSPPRPIKVLGLSRKSAMSRKILVAIKQQMLLFPDVCESPAFLRFLIKNFVLAFCCRGSICSGERSENHQGGTVEGVKSASETAKNMNRRALRDIKNIIRAPHQHLSVSKRGPITMFVSCFSLYLPTIQT